MGKGTEERESCKEGNGKEEETVKRKGECKEMERVREKSKREKMRRKGTTERDDFYSKCGVMAELIALSRG